MNIERAVRYQHPEFDWQTLDGICSGTHDGIQLTIKHIDGTYRLAGRFSNSMLSENATTLAEALEAIPRMIRKLLG